MQSKVKEGRKERRRKEGREEERAGGKEGKRSMKYWEHKSVSQSGIN